MFTSAFHEWKAKNSASWHRLAAEKICQSLTLLEPAVGFTEGEKLHGDVSFPTQVRQEAERNKNFCGQTRKIYWPRRFFCPWGALEGKQQICWRLHNDSSNPKRTLEDVFTGKKWYNENMKKDYLERQGYPTDLTDEQWDEIEPLFVGMREYKHSKRELTNAVLYLVNSGCKWRQLSHDFPPHFTVHSFYRRARLSGLWDSILQHLVKVTRKNADDQLGFDGKKKQK